MNTPAGYKIFFCEYDRNLGEMVREYLMGKGFAVDLFIDSSDAMQNFSAENYDLCLVDVIMPGMDGYAIAHEIREISPDMPLIFVSSLTQKEEVIRGFLAGADDYVTKPMSLQELQLRIEAVLRRAGQSSSSVKPYYQLGQVIFDTARQTLHIQDQVIKLTSKESDLLTLLCTHANNTLERNYALKKIWSDDNYFTARSMDVYVTKLRKILKADPSIEIKNVHGRGYRLVTPAGRITPDMITEI